MPIAHLTTREASFPRLGKFKKGAPKEQGLKDLEYFRIDSDRDRVVQRFREAYGNEPKELRVWLPYPTVEENFDAWMKEYGTGSLKRMCNGSEQVMWLEGASYKGVHNDDAPIPCVRKQGGKCGCKETALLKVMVIELFEQGIIGYFDVETHSKWDILTIQSNLEAAYRLRPNLCGIPFVLRRTPNNISTPRGETRSRTEKWLLSIEPDATWVSKQFQDMYQQAIAGNAAASLPSVPSFSLPEAVEEESGAIAVEIVEEPQYLSKTSSEAIWKAAKAVGHTPESAKEILKKLEIESFKAIPINKAEEVRKALLEE